MIEFKNKVFVGSNQRKSLFDCQIPQGAQALIVFMHGYKGFKDWGAWNLMVEKLLEHNIACLKFNASHNGGTIDNLIDFDDLEAFALNRYSYEVNDLSIMIDEAHRLLHDECQLDIPLFVMGHSRGGGIAILEGSKNDKVDGVISLAGISDIGSRFPSGEALQQWKRKGVMFVSNARTNQEMPHYFSFYEDFLQNEQDLSIEAAAEKLKKPFVQIHGDMDLAVSISEGLQIAKWTNTRIKIIKGGDHTFGAKHPHTHQSLTDQLEEVVQHVLDFVNTQPI